MNSKPGIDAVQSTENGSVVANRTVLAAAVAAVVIRLAALLISGDIQPYSSLRETYWSTAAGLASGYGYVIQTPAAVAEKHGFPELISSVKYIRQREAAGGRVDAEHPYPRNVENWAPGTQHPHGYGTLVYLLYRTLNYTPALWALHLIQILAEAAACVFVFIFARNIFDARVGRIAAWLYALCPPAIFLSLDLMPDAFHGFFISLTLALASFTRFGRLRYAAFAGAALGLGCHFRTEYILLPGALFFAMWAMQRRFLLAAGQTALMAATMLAVLLPWAIWMRSTIGEFRFTSTTGGGGLYSCLGEDPGNPWNIKYDDAWITADATKRGFDTPWGPAANKYYSARFREYVKSYPFRYASMVLVQRLPLALAPPYDTGNRATRKEFNFTKYRLEEGLTRWGVVRKYPLRVFRYMWPQVAMLVYSGTLSLCVIALPLLRPRQWRQAAWIVLPWAYTVFSISLYKGIEPRNIAPTLVTGVTALTLASLSMVDWRRRKQSSA